MRYGSTSSDHKVYVSVGDKSKRFGQNSNNGKMCVALVACTLVACLVYSASPEHRDAGLAQQRSVVSSALPSTAAMNQLSEKLAAKQVLIFPATHFMQLQHTHY